MLYDSVYVGAGASVSGVKSLEVSVVRRLNITAKIWLSIGIFVLGYVLSTALGQWSGISSENSLRTTSEALFPAAQRSQEAEPAFQRVVKALSDAVLVQDASEIDRAAEEGRRIVEGLHATAATPGLAADRSAQAKKLAATIEPFLADARNLYSTVLANPAGMTVETQEGMHGLAARIDALKIALKQAKDQLSSDLHERLRAMQSRSAQQRWLALLMFGMTLLVAWLAVHLTIRRAITGPILRVIEGVQAAAGEASQASDRMAESGRVVARDSQEQAAYIEETSASLEEIAATTRGNADRAKEADGLMSQAGHTMQRATKAMDDLKESMNVISKSSKQVAEVLKSIDEIAFHTNILALNAAVEAARAGEVGAGFSVVADEVRSLAHRAAEAAQRSADIIEKTIHDVGKGVDLVSQAHGAFQEVSGTISSGSQAVNQIAASSEEQARGITHIRQAIARMGTVTQNNAANAGQTAEAASTMSTQVENTRKHIEELVAVVGSR
jgi:Methyl-accepting chemotaxis protein (MCP) signalling domain